jgi:hypothetical protein
MMIMPLSMAVIPPRPSVPHDLKRCNGAPPKRLSRGVGICISRRQSYHIPLIIRCPVGAVMGGGGGGHLSAASQAAVEAARGRIVHDFSEHVDLLPTILECAGMPVPVQADGSSLLPFLLGRPAPASWRTAAHWEFGEKNGRAQLTKARAQLTAAPRATTFLRLPRSQPACGCGALRVLALCAPGRALEVRPVCRSEHAASSLRYGCGGLGGRKRQPRLVDGARARGCEGGVRRGDASMADATC